MSVNVFRSLRVRLIVGVVVIEILMLSLLVWSNMRVIRRAHADRLRDTAASLLQEVAATSGSYMVEVDYARLKEYLSSIAENPELSYLVVLDRDRHPVVRLGSAPAGYTPETDHSPAGVSDHRFDVADDIVFGGRKMGRVLMGFSLARMERAIHAARVHSVSIAAAEIVLTILATVLIGMHLTRRLGRLAEAAQRVGAGDYSVAVSTETDDEIGMTAAAFNGMVAEISARTRQLKAALARERVVKEVSIDGMITYDAASRILSLNPAMTSLFGYAQQELLGRRTDVLLTAIPDDSDFWIRATDKCCEIQGRRRDGGVFPLEVHVGWTDIDGRRLYAATLRDVTERKRAESECRGLLASNRYLVHKSLAVQEQERRHLARELHDELGQCMTAIQADAKLIQELPEPRDARVVAASAGAIMQVSARVYDVVHSMMQRLRPTVLDDLGLVAALQEAVTAWGNLHPGVRCDFSARGALGELGESVNITLYRLVQEALTNVAKHARASRVRIRLERGAGGTGGGARADAVFLLIEDDGRGMDPSQPGRGLGLIGMRERVAMLNGALEMRSSPGAGLTLAVAVPATNGGDDG